MGKLTYSAEQQKVLSLHKYVERCGDKQVIFTREFKELAARQYDQGKTPHQIFEDAEFGVKVFEYDYMRHRIINWRAKVRRKGWDALGEDNRGRPAKNRLAKLSDREKIEALELKVKYLEAEKDFLIKRRAHMGL